MVRIDRKLSHDRRIRIVWWESGINGKLDGNRSVRIDGEVDRGRKSRINLERDVDETKIDRSLVDCGDRATQPLWRTGSDPVRTGRGW